MIGAVYMQDRRTIKTRWKHDDLALNTRWLRQKRPKQFNENKNWRKWCRIASSITPKRWRVDSPEVSGRSLCLFFRLWKRLFWCTRVTFLTSWSRKYNKISRWQRNESATKFCSFEDFLRKFFLWLMSLQNQVTRCRCQPVLPSSNQWNLASKRKLGKRHQNQPETLLATNFFGHSTQGSARVKQTPSRCHQPMTYGCRCNSKNIFAFDAIIGTAFWKKRHGNTLIWPLL